MPRVMTEKGQELLEMYPYFMQADPVIQAICNAEGEEFVLLHEKIDELSRNLIVGTASEHLYLYESLLKLPVAPVGLSEAARLGIVLAFMSRATISGSGIDWERVATQILGVTWTYSVGGTNNSVLTVQIPYAPGSIQTQLLEILLETITPASMVINVTFTDGFILDASLLDDDLIG